MAIFEIFGIYVQHIFNTVSETIAASISMNRITDFLHNVCGFFHVLIPVVLTDIPFSPLQTELIDDFPENPSESTVLAVAQSASPITSAPPTEYIHDIGFSNAAFTWSKESAAQSVDGTSTPSLSSSRRRFLLKVEEKVIFKQGHLNLILGPTGSGKTALLLALLGWCSSLYTRTRC
jgi:ABC-type multidrug transport system fused ATPase/permease subunit